MTTAPSSPPDGRGAALARLVELALVVPVEITSRLVDVVPAVVDKVPSATARVRQEVVLARFLGKMVVDQGLRELRAKLTPDVETPSTVAGARGPSTPTRPISTESVQVDTEHEVEATDVPDVSEVPVPQMSSLALADYDHLSSAQVVGKLDGLDAAERRAIERYERAGRRRRTILGKLAQLDARA